MLSPLFEVAFFALTPYLQYSCFNSFEPLLSFSRSGDAKPSKPCPYSDLFFEIFYVTALKSIDFFYSSLSCSRQSCAWVLRFITFWCGERMHLLLLDCLIKRSLLFLSITSSWCIESFLRCALKWYNPTIESICWRFIWRVFIDMRLFSIDCVIMLAKVIVRFLTMKNCRILLQWKHTGL